MIGLPILKANTLAQGSYWSCLFTSGTSHSFSWYRPRIVLARTYNTRRTLKFEAVRGTDKSLPLALRGRDPSKLISGATL